MFAKKKTPVETVVVTDATGEKVTDGRLIAVLTAAALAYTAVGGSADDNLTVGKIDRTAGPRTAWNLAGLREVIASRSL